MAGLTVPTIITYVYFDLLADSSPIAQKSAYAIGKMLQLSVLCLALWQWKPWRTQRTSVATGSLHQWLWIGAASGIAIGVLMIVAYRWVLTPTGLLEPVKEVAKEKLQKLGSDSPIVLLAIAVFYSVVHSGFEELYWRGFVYRGLSAYCTVPVSLSISSLGFMSHHVVVLGKFFGYDSALTYLCSLGVAIGGAIWAFFYGRSHRLLPGWISHSIVDATIFGIGYQLLFLD
jgi:uncharacterized protein